MKFLSLTEDAGVKKGKRELQKLVKNYRDSRGGFGATAHMTAQQISKRTATINFGNAENEPEAARFLKEDCGLITWLEKYGANARVEFARHCFTGKADGQVQIRIKW